MFCTEKLFFALEIQMNVNLPEVVWFCPHDYEN